MAANLELVIKAVDHASGTLGDIDKKAGGLGHTMGNVLKVGALGAAVGIGAAAVAAISFIKQAAEEEAGIARLAAAIDANGGSWERQGAAIEKAIQQRQKLAFSDDELRSSLAMLTAQTGNVDEAMNRQTVAMDLARGANIDLGSASKLLGKVTDESHGALSRLGIVVDKNADSAEVLAAVQARFGGQSAAFAETAAGKWARVNIQFDNIKETIGAALLPIVAKLADKLATFLEEHQGDIERIVQQVKEWAESKAWPFLLKTFDQLKQLIQGVIDTGIVQWLMEHKEVLLALVLALGVLALAFGGPVVGIIAIIAIGAVLLAHWDEIKAKADEIIKKVREFPVLGEIVEAVFGFMANWVKLQMDTIKAVIDIVMGILTGDWDRAWQGLKALAMAPLEFLKADLGVVLDLIKGIFGDAWKAIKDTVISAINAVIGTVEGGVNKVIEAIRGLFQKVKDIADAFPGPNPLGNAMQAAIDGMSAVTLGRIETSGEEASRLGKAVVDGAKRGIELGTPAMIAAAQHAADGVTGAMKREWKLQSPSRVMIQIGQQLTEGLRIGMSATPSLLRLATAAPRSISAPATASVSSGGTHIHLHSYTLTGNIPPSQQMQLEEWLKGVVRRIAR